MTGNAEMQWRDTVKTARNALFEEIEKMYPGQQLPGGGFACQKAGCGKPTWNGQPNEYCSKVCKTSMFMGTYGNYGPSSYAGPSFAPMGAGGGVGGFATGTYTCRKAGCNKPTWNGQPGEYCSKGCKAEDQANQFPAYGGPLYSGQQAYGGSTSHNTGPSFAGQGQSFAGQGPSYPGAHRQPAICMKPGCGKPTYNGQPNEYCSKACKNEYRPQLQPQSHGGNPWW